MGILCQVWCLIVSVPDLCPLSYFASKDETIINILLGVDGNSPLPIYERFYSTVDCEHENR